MVSRRLPAPDATVSRVSIPSSAGTASRAETAGPPETDRPAMLFDLDGTLVDSVYQHVLAWQEALSRVGIELSVWRSTAGSG